MLRGKKNDTHTQKDELKNIHMENNFWKKGRDRMNEWLNGILL